MVIDNNYLKCVRKISYLVKVSGVIEGCFRGEPSVGEIGCGLTWPPGIPAGRPPGKPPGSPAPGRIGG